MSHDQLPAHSYQQTEIDLIKLVKGLWAEKITILTCIFITGLITTGYIFTLKPIYAASVELTPPLEHQISRIKPIIPTAESDTFLYTPDASLKQQQQLVDLIKRGRNVERGNNENVASTENIKEEISAKDAFILFLSTLESSTHIHYMLTKESELLKTALNIDTSNEGAINDVKLVRKVEYADTKSKQNELEPDSYFLTLNGYDRKTLKTLIIKDINIASQYTTKRIKSYYIGQMNQQLQHTLVEQKAEILSIEKRIKARKWYLNESQKNDISKLKEKLEISSKLENKEQTKKLSATLTTLEKRKSDIFYDTDLLSMLAQKKIIEENTLIPQLQTKIENLRKHNTNIRFSSSAVISPIAPIAPRKILILGLGLVAGLFIGLILAARKYIYKCYSDTEGNS
jgi:LPS O-antigen subunit length determinant protein (WzzB/FepE family)